MSPHDDVGRLAVRAGPESRRGERTIVQHDSGRGDLGELPGWRQKPHDMAQHLRNRKARALDNPGDPVQTGQFQAMMQVEIINDGPVTIILDSDEM